MPQITLKTQIEKSYEQLRSVLLKNNCRVVSEEPPNQIRVKQGSLSGISPKNAKKTINYQLFSSIDSETKISAFSTISKDWAYLTLYGSILAAVVAGVFLWIANDVENYLANAKVGVWSWLAKAYGYPDLQTTTFMINITRATAVFLFAAIALELAIVMYVYPRKNDFAQEVLNKLKEESTDNNLQV